MTDKEAIDYNKNLKEYMKITDKTSEYKFLQENYEALDMAIKALEQEPKWIPISERPPGDRQKCLISIEEMVDIARYSTNLYEVDEYDFYDKKNVAGFYDYDGECGYFQVHNVEAWMPSPSSYKVESEVEK